MDDLKTHYQKTVIPQLQKEFNIANPQAAPRITKVAINVSLGQAAHDQGLLNSTINDLATITGQKAHPTQAKKSIANFKIRTGDPIGAAVTLRKRHLEDFLTKLFHIVLPRIRDFQGLKISNFDQQANFTIGLPEQTLFPEISYDKINRIQGLQVTIVTSTSDQAQAKRLLELMGLPFAKPKNK
jgi:large subunit ribosomal protein L5